MTERGTANLLMQTGTRTQQNCNRETRNSRRRRATVSIRHEASSSPLPGRQYLCAASGRQASRGGFLALVADKTREGLDTSQIKCSISTARAYRAADADVSRL